MDDRKVKTRMKNKFDEVVGLFWGASLFMGALVCVIIGFGGNGSTDWLKAGLIGACVFLSAGLLLHGLIVLLRKEK